MSMFDIKIYSPKKIKKLPKFAEIWKWHKIVIWQEKSNF